MISWRKNLFWIWSSLFLAMTGFYLAYPVMPFLLKDVYNMTSEQELNVYTSLFVFAGNLGFLIFSPIWGKMADIYGRKMMMTRANFCSFLLLPFLAFMPNAPMLVVVRFFIGAFAGVVSSALTLVACSTPQRHRGMAMGAISSAVFSGMLSGMVLGGFSAGYLGYNWTFFLCAFLLLLATLISFFLVEERGLPPLAGTKYKMKINFDLPKFGNIWYLMILTMGMGYVQLLDGPFLPLLVADIVNTTSAEAMKWNGVLGGACAGAGILGGFIIGILIDRFSGYKVGVIISLLGALFLLPQAFCYDLTYLFGERMVMVFFVSGLSPIMQTWLSLTTAAKDRGTNFGYATSFRAIGWLLGGAVGMVVSYFSSTRMVFVTAAVCLVLFAIMIVFFQRKIPYPILFKPSAKKV